jgi:hypothetical protein
MARETDKCRMKTRPSKGRPALSAAARAQLEAPYRFGAVLDLMRSFSRAASAPSVPRRAITKPKKD